jgi:hypothetical protein
MGAGRMSSHFSTWETERIDAATTILYVPYHAVLAASFVNPDERPACFAGGS